MVEVPLVYDDVGLEREQLGRVFAIEFGIARAPAVVDVYVTAAFPTQFL